MTRISTAVLLLAGLGASLGLGACSSSDGGSSDAGPKGGTLSGILGKFGGNGSGTGAAGDAGAGTVGDGGVPSAGGATTDCLTACGLVFVCVNQACGTSYANDCATECASVTDPIPLDANATCDQAAASLGVASFNDLCDDAAAGHAAANPDAGTGTGGGNDSTCCTYISCAQACGSNQECVMACLTSFCPGGDVPNCSDDLQACASEVAGCVGGGGGATGGSGGSGSGGGGTVDPAQCCDYIHCAQGCGSSADASACAQGCVADVCPGNDLSCLQALSSACATAEVVQSCLGQ